MTHSLNPLIEKSDLPYGAPVFARVKPEHYEPAIKWAIEQGEKNLAAIRNNPDEPTFENTIVPFAFADEELMRIGKTIGVFTLVANTKDVQRENKKITELETDFQTAQFMDEVIFERVKQVYQKKDTLGLNEEESVLLKQFYDAFISNGVGLKGKQREAYKELKRKESANNQVLNDNAINHAQQLAVYIGPEEQNRLDGIPADIIEKYREMALSDEKTPKGGYKIPMMPLPVPVLTYAKDRSLREETLRVLESKCASGEFDNHGPYRKNLEFKYEAAQMLGYEHFADYMLQTEQRMTGDYKEVMKFVENNAINYHAAAKEFYGDVLEFAHKKDGIEALKPWDTRYYINLYKEEKIGMDSEAVRPYFELNNVLDGAFNHAEKLYSVRFQKAEVGQYETAHDDVAVYEVYDNKTGEIQALYYANFFSNDNKRGGAWMEDLRPAGLYQGEYVIPIITNDMNLQKPQEGKPTLLTDDEVATLFHEMGHALHGMMSKGVFPQLAGTNTSRDYIEMPSQINECWAFKSEVLATYAFHHETGEVIPAELIEKLQQVEAFDEQWQGLRQTHFGLIDMIYHSQNPNDIESFEVLEKEVRDRYPISALDNSDEFPAKLLTFMHLVDEDYAAGYYVYKWADALVADVRTAFELAEKNGEGCYPAELCRNFKENMIVPGGSQSAADMLASFKKQAGCYEHSGFDAKAMFKAKGIPVVA